MKDRGLDRTGWYAKKIMAGVIITLLLVFMLFLTVSAFLETSELNTNDISGEHIDFCRDNFFLNIITAALCILALYLFYRQSGSFSLKKIETLLLLYCFVFGTLFILSVKLRSPNYSDSFIITYAAQRAAVGDFAQLEEEYFQCFPFQLGYVLYSELFFRAMGLVFRGFPEGYFCLALQEVNLLWLMLAYHSVIRLSQSLSADTRVGKLTALLLFFCFQPIMSCTLLYGNIPAFGCGCAAVRMLSDYLKSGKISDAIVCTLLLTLAVMLKLNLLIFCAAAAILWLLDALEKRSLKSAVCLVLAVLCVLTVSKLPQRVYEKRVGTDFGGGIPMIAWMAMGFSEGHAAPGWYSEEHTVDAFAHCGNNAEETAENAKHVLAERVHDFLSHPADAFRFFSAKLRSQWNEPTYQSQWINEVHFSYGEKGRLYRMLCGSGERPTRGFMNQVQQIVFAGMVLGVFLLRKKRDIRCLILPLVILGGLSYHLLFEAKSQYALPYFVMMVPLAAFGLAAFFKRIDER